MALLVIFLSDRPCCSCWGYAIIQCKYSAQDTPRTCWVQHLPLSIFDCLFDADSTKLVITSRAQVAHHGTLIVEEPCIVLLLLT